MNDYLTLRGYWDEAVQRNEQALQAARHAQTDSDIAVFAHNTGIIHQSRGNLAEARRLYDESLEISKTLGDQSGIAITLGQLGMLAQEEGDVAEAVRLISEALVIYERLKSPNAERARRILERLKGKSS